MTRNECRWKIEWYLASFDMAASAALSGIRHRYPKTDPWIILARRWRNEDEERRQALSRMLRTFLKSDQRKAT